MTAYELRISDWSSDVCSSDLCPTLHAEATVADLARVEWARIEQGWEGGPADWNRMRTAVSRLLSIVTGDKFSAFRREIMKRIPELEEPEGRTDRKSTRLYSRH